MKNKRLVTAAAAITAGVLLVGTAFAQSPDAVQETETTAVTQIRETAESNSPLTPAGNLTLVDDVTAKTDTSKQFLTFVSKSGNYFYMVVDHDKDGEDNVHFLNLVDEEDLLAVMDEEAASSYQEHKNEIIEKIPETEPETDETEIVPPTEPDGNEAERGNMNMRKRLPAIAALLVLMGGAGAFVFNKLKSKKKDKTNAKDPDIDYIEDDEYEDDEDFMDAYEEDDFDE